MASMAIVPFEPRLSSRQDMTWPGTALDDAQAHGTIVERMARVLGVYRGPYTSAGGGAGEHYEEHPHEDDIDYQDEPEELYGGPDLISALPAGLKAGPTHFLLLGREMTNYIFLFFVFGSQSSISDTRAPARRLAWSSCTSRPQPLQRWRPLAGHGTPSASAQTACGMTRHAAARPSPPPAARGAVRRRAWPGGAKSALHRRRHQLLLLEGQWPGSELPGEELIESYYEMGGKDPIVWARRYFKAQAVSNKVSAMAMEVASPPAARPRLPGLPPAALGCVLLRGPGSTTRPPRPLIIRLQTAAASGRESSRS